MTMLTAADARRSGGGERIEAINEVCYVIPGFTEHFVRIFADERRGYPPLRTLPCGKVSASRQALKIGTRLQAGTQACRQALAFTCSLLLLFRPRCLPCPPSRLESKNGVVKEWDHRSPGGRQLVDLLLFPRLLFLPRWIVPRLPREKSLTMTVALPLPYLFRPCHSSRRSSDPGRTCLPSVISCLLPVVAASVVHAERVPH